MRLYHLLLAVLFVALILGIARDEVGRVALIVFFTGLGELVFGLTTIMALFQTVSAIGYARSAGEYAEAVAATALVVLLAAVLMNGVLWVGMWMVQGAVA